MSDEKTNVKCKLMTRGTAKVEESVADDLLIPDPSDSVGRDAIAKATKEDTENDC